MSAFLIAAGCGAILFSLIVLLFGTNTAKADAVRSRLDGLGEDVSRAYILRDDELNKPFTVRVLVPLIRKLTVLVTTILPIKGVNDAASEKQKKMLMQAGWTISSEEYTVLQLVAMVGGGALGLVVALFYGGGENIALYTLVGLLGGYTLLRYACTSAGTRRKAAMEKQLPDLLDLLCVSVAAGLGFERAILHLVETMDGPLIDEFAVTYREMSMGRSRKDALTLLGERCGIEDLSSVTGALVQAGQLGIPIRNVLHTQSAAIRRSHRAKVQEKAAKVSTKILLPMVGLIFPVLIIVLMGPSLITVVEQFS